MRIAVFGANGPTGQQVTRLGLDRGHEIVAFTRRPDSFPIEHRLLEVAGGDVHDPVAVASVIEGTDAVISTLGAPFAKTPVTVYSEGITNIIAGMHAAGTKRLVCVTSSVLDPYPGPLGGFVFEKIMQPYVVKKLGKTVYDDMRRLERIVSDSDLDWTIVRPSGLVDVPAVTDYRVADEPIAHRYTARIDLADCLLRQVIDGTYQRSGIAVVSPSLNPSMLKLIVKEAIGKR